MSQPELSFLAPQNFYLQIDSLPEVSFFCQQVQIPSLTGGEAELPNRYNSGKTFIPGDGVDYGTLDVTFLVDKKLENYTTVMRWLKGINAPETQGQWSDYQKNENHTKFGQSMETMTVVCTDASQEPLAEWKFYSAFPVSLDGFSFDSSMPDIEYMTAVCSFRFHYFEMVTYQNGTIIDKV